jgi:hypothetical protein
MCQDDLLSGKGDEYVALSTRMLVMLSPRYFMSANCIRELLCAAFLNVPVDVVMEAKTAMTREDVRMSLEEAERRMEKWGLRNEMESRGFHPPPRQSYAKLLFQHLFRHEPLEWSNVPAYHSVFLRVLAGRLVMQLQHTSTRRLDLHHNDVRATAMRSSDMGETSHPRENGSRDHSLSSPRLLNQAPRFMRRSMAHLSGRHSVERQFDVQAEGLDTKVAVVLPRKHKYHLFVSSNNLGAAKLVEEAAAAFVAGGSVLTTDNPHELVRGSVSCVLLYLNSQTWTSGEATDALVREVILGRSQRIEFLLAHEHPGIESNQVIEPRYECDFDECAHADLTRGELP